MGTASPVATATRTAIIVAVTAGSARILLWNGETTGAVSKYSICNDCRLLAEVADFRGVFVCLSVLY